MRHATICATSNVPHALASAKNVAPNHRLCAKMTGQKMKASIAYAMMSALPNGQRGPKRPATSEPRTDPAAMTPNATPTCAVDGRRSRCSPARATSSASWR